MHLFTVINAMYALFAWGEAPPSGIAHDLFSNQTQKADGEKDAFVQDLVASMTIPELGANSILHMTVICFSTDDI